MMMMTIVIVLNNYDEWSSVTSTVAMMKLTILRKLIMEVIDYFYDLTLGWLIINPEEQVASIWVNVFLKKNDRTGMQNKQKFTMHKNKEGNVLRFSLTWDRWSWVQDGWPSLPPKNFYLISSYLRLIILCAIYRAKTRNTGRSDSKYSFWRNPTLIYFFIVHPLTPLMVWWTQVGVCKLINSHIEKNMSGHYANIRNYQCKTVDISQYFKSKLRTH